MTWTIKWHPDFAKDLRKLSKQHLSIFYNKKKKIKQNPVREKHLGGGDNCYREPITKNVRLVYFVSGDVIWLLTIGKHEAAYARHRQRLHSLRERYGLQARERDGDGIELSEWAKKQLQNARDAPDSDYMTHDKLGEELGLQ